MLPLCQPIGDFLARGQDRVPEKDTEIEWPVLVSSTDQLVPSLEPCRDQSLGSLSGASFAEAIEYLVIT